MARTLQQVDTDLAALQARVNAIDGQNLPSTQVPVIAELVKEINGLRTTLNQISLTIQSTLSALNSRVGNLETTVQNYLSSH